MTTTTNAASDIIATVLAVIESLTLDGDARHDYGTGKCVEAVSSLSAHRASNAIDDVLRARKADVTAADLTPAWSALRAMLRTGEIEMLSHSRCDATDLAILRTHCEKIRALMS
jgi:hypothetical protein